MYRVAMVCEGPTDQAIIEAILDDYVEDYESISIQPPITAIGGSAGIYGAGWKGVRTWCRQEAAGVNITNITQNFDLLIIQVDADVMLDAKVNLHVTCPPPVAGANAIRALILKWLDVNTAPDKVVLCVPSMATETWALVALFPDVPEILLCNPHPVDAECIECYSEVKATLRKLSKNFRTKLVVSQNGRLKNQAKGYRARQTDIMHGWNDVVKKCSQALCFDLDLKATLNL